MAMVSVEDRMSVPLAAVTGRPRRELVVELLTISIALAAVASSWLTLVDAQLLASCGCDATFRPADDNLFIPSLTLAIVGLARLGGPSPSRRSAVLRVVSMLATSFAVLGCLAAFLMTMSAVGGLAARVVTACHVELLVMLVVRRRWGAWRSTLARRGKLLASGRQLPIGAATSR